MQNNGAERLRAVQPGRAGLVARRGRPIAGARVNPRRAGRRKPVLVTGATGYIGGRLVPRLLEAGHRVRCLVRDPAKLSDRWWSAHPDLEIVQCDLGETDRLAHHMAGCGPAFYLVHSMEAAGARYAEEDRRLAASFAAAAETAGLSRIIYLGGLGETGQRLSRHLSSRREVETLLASGRVPVTVLRAAMIIGSGSASFEILRYLVERLPVMITPRWVRTECQPIAIRDVLHYLTACLQSPATVGRTLDIGGPDVLSYREMMRIMAEARGLPPRLILPVPVLTPRISSLWIHLVTPVGHRVARPLAEGLRNRVVCRSDEAARLMPGPRLLAVREAVEAALGQVENDEVETSWSDAGVVFQGMLNGIRRAAERTASSRREETRATSPERWRSPAHVIHHSNPSSERGRLRATPRVRPVEEMK